jgi:hypothetical protein
MNCLISWTCFGILAVVVAASCASAEVLVVNSRFRWCARQDLLGIEATRHEGCKRISGEDETGNGEAAGKDICQLPISSLRTDYLSSIFMLQTPQASS